MGRVRYECSRTDFGSAARADAVGVVHAGVVADAGSSRERSAFRRREGGIALEGWDSISPRAPDAYRTNFATSSTSEIPVLTSARRTQMAKGPAVAPVIIDIQIRERRHVQTRSVNDVDHVPT